VVVGDLSTRARTVRAALRKPAFLAALTDHLNLTNWRAGVAATWVQAPCFGFDFCGMRCGDGRSCLVCGPCGADGGGGCVGQDACGVCGGDGSSCRGCDGEPFSGKVFDGCGVCDGDGSSCKGCDGVANSGAKEDRCGVCGGGNADADACACCPETSPVCAAAPAESKPYQCAPTCVADGTTCAGCDGVLNRSVCPRLSLPPFLPFSLPPSLLFSLPPSLPPL
jgi:hypothetical protein